MHLVQSRAFHDQAFAAYFRQAQREGREVDQPSSPDTYFDDGTGRRYVVLSNRHGILAVYRVRTDEALRRLSRWPSELIEAHDGRPTPSQLRQRRFDRMLRHHADAVGLTLRKMRSPADERAYVLLQYGVPLSGGPMEACEALDEIRARR